MRHFIPLALATALALTACGQPDPSQVGPSTVNQAPVGQAPINQAQAVPTQVEQQQLHPSHAVVEQLIAAAQAPVVKDLGFKNGPSLAVSISPKEVKRMIQAIQHRWVAADIQNYTVTLTGSSTGVMATSTVTSTSSNTSATPGAFAAFTGLPAGQNYVVNVVANGYAINPADGSVTTTLVSMNSQTPASATFSFVEDANHNINNTAPSQNINVTLDSFQFSGSAESTVSVNNGTWLPPDTNMAIFPLPAAPLTFVDATSDLISGADYTPDGVPDAHYRYTRNFAAPTAIGTIKLVGSSGIWSATNFGPPADGGQQYVLAGVYLNGVPQTQMPQNPWNSNPPVQIGPLSGYTTLDIYIDGTYTGPMAPNYPVTMYVYDSNFNLIDTQTVQ